MAERLDSFQFSRENATGSRYDKYLDGGIYRLLVGEDVPSLSFRVHFYSLAKKRGMKARVHAESDPPALVVQAYTPTKAAA